MLYVLTGVWCAWPVEPEERHPPTRSKSSNSPAGPRLTWETQEGWDKKDSRLISVSWE